MPYIWYVEPLAKTVTASKLVAGQWLELGTWGNSEIARIEPFDAVEIDLAAWWEGVEDSTDEGEEGSPMPPSAENPDI